MIRRRERRAPTGEGRGRLFTARPAEPLDADAPLSPSAADRAWLDRLVSSPRFERIAEYFRDYPARSFMSDRSRAFLYTLIRDTRPSFVAEIGTLFAGTSEVMARSLWENGTGTLLTTDPFGAERVPQAMVEWPDELRAHVEFSVLSSMDFFNRLVDRRTELDVVLVDGNHDLEYALFDLQMSARILRPGGVIVMDNAEQSGPFFAARRFVAQSPGWSELGDALATFDPARPFEPRASIPGTSFLVLRAPDVQAIVVEPRSWGQLRVRGERLSGLVLEASEPSPSGVLRYQLILRAFFDGARRVDEHKRLGEFPVRAGSLGRVEQLLPEPVVAASPESADDFYTIEIELSWLPDSGADPLQLAGPPQPLV